MNSGNDNTPRSAISSLTLDQALQRISEIEIVIKKLSEETKTGRHLSHFSGTGSEFSEIREYHYGDDIRAIDWNSTARFCETCLRVFTEEHDTAIYLAIDRSASGNFGKNVSKDEKIFEIAVSLLFSALISGDSTGICLFTDKIEGFIPAGKGRKHTALMLNLLLSHRPESVKTDIGKAISHLHSKIKKRALIIILSDFDSGSFKDEILLLNRRHEVRAIRIKDRSESEIPDAGYLMISDPETGEEILVNTSDENFRRNYREIYAAEEEALNGIFNVLGIVPFEIFTDEDYVSSLKTYFRSFGKVAK